MSNQTVNCPWTTLVSQSSTKEFFPASGWTTTQGIREIRAVVEIAVIDGTGPELEPAYQLADTYDDPNGAVSTVSSPYTSAAYHFPTTYADATSGTQNVKNNQIIRFGYLFSDTESNGSVRVASAFQIVRE